MVKNTEKRILQINSLGYIGGGSEVVIVKVSRYLRDKGYSVRTLASDLGADKKHFNDYTFKSASSAGFLKLLFLLFNPSSFFTLRRVLNEYQPDIVHFHLMNEITPSALFLLRDYPTVMTLHAPESFLNKLLIWFLQPSDFNNHSYDNRDLNLGGKFRYLYFNSIQKFLYNIGLKNVDVFIAPSRYMQKVAQLDVSPVLHLPNFVDLGEYHALQINYSLLFVGRLEKIKGVEFLIKAIPSIIKVFPQATLTIIGEGRHKADLLNLTAELQLEKNIRFVGWVENENLDSYYKNANIVVIPSICQENFPTVCNEAMSRGRPVIGTRVGGIPEIIDDGVNGYVVEPENPERIAEKVIKLFSEKNLLEELGRNARKKAGEFSIEKHVRNLEKIYEDVISKHRTIDV